MQYRTLGSSGLKVSEIALGSWLTYGDSTERQTALACIHRAYELGINYFDTANQYNYGQAERVVGEALARFPRESYVLGTKVYFPMGDGPNDRGLSRKHIIEQCEASLRRLGVDYIDLYQCHRYDESVPLEETLRALDDLINQGKVLYTGVSEWSGAQLTAARAIQDKRNLHPIISNQPIYNMLVRYIENDVLAVSKELGIGQVVFSPLAQGILTGKYIPGEPLPKDSRATNNQINQLITGNLDNRVLASVQQLGDIAASVGISLPQLAISWVLRQPGVSSAIIGASRPSQIDENVKAIDVSLSQQTLSDIDTVLQDIADFKPVW